MHNGYLNLICLVSDEFPEEKIFKIFKNLEDEAVYIVIATLTLKTF